MPLNGSTNPGTPRDFYPIGLCLTGKTVMVVGAGKVAARKLKRLVKTGCHLVVISPDIPATVSDLLTDGTHTLLQEAYSTTHLTAYTPVLVFACTDKPDVNQHIAEEAQHQGIWVNSATDGTRLGDFIVPSLIDYDALQVALFSGGASPLFTRKLRESIESLVGPWAGPYLAVLRQVRGGLQREIPDETCRRELYETLLSDESLLAQAQAGPIEVEALAQQILDRLKAGVSG